MLSDDQFERLKAELEEGYSGRAQRRAAAAARRRARLEGDGLSPKDMDFIEAKHAAAREIALAFGVPPMLLGIPGDNTYANYQEANRAFWRQTVLPLAWRIGARSRNGLRRRSATAAALGRHRRNGGARR